MTRKTNVLFVMLDSSRYDAFAAAQTPNLSAIGPLVRAFSPSHFTFSAHATFFMAFTPGDPTRRKRFVNSNEAAIVVCGDHGDCWGEDGLWEHGIHPRTPEVPLLFRLP